MKKDKILNIIILLTFIMIIIFVGANHEPWADEAQSWLIARDASVTEILCTIERYEGTPPLWHLLLKFLIKLGYQYEYLYLISVFFSSLGIGLFLFKLNVPTPIKILFPFSYFILYEYTVKTRSYCLIVPILVLIASIYKDREKKIILYNVLLGILATISLHAALISGILYLFEIFDITYWIINEKKLKKFMKAIISCIVLGCLYCLILLCVMTTSDVLVPTTINTIKESEENIFENLLPLLICLLEAFTLNVDIMTYAHFIFSLIYFLAIMFLILKKNKNKILFLTIFLSEVMFILLIRVANHHIGLMLYAFLFALYLVKDDIAKQNKKMLCLFLSVMFIVQIYWSIITIIPEIKYNYSAALDVVNYLEEIDYKNKRIYSSGYYAVAILPYFSDNIFYNDRGGTNYYRWSKNNKDWILSSNDEFLYQKQDEELPDIIIFYDNPEKEVYNYLIKKVSLMKEYKKMHFDGNRLYKGIRDTAENNNYEGYYVFERVK